jgi:hypothetical protein
MKIVLIFWKLRRGNQRQMLLFTKSSAKTSEYVLVEQIYAFFRHCLCLTNIPLYCQTCLKKEYLLVLLRNKLTKAVFKLSLSAGGVICGTKTTARKIKHRLPIRILICQNNFCKSIDIDKNAC